MSENDALERVLANHPKLIGATYLLLAGETTMETTGIGSGYTGP
ncbi:hypothetical protein ACFQPA_03435 [Halomarina halobia]|uniref:Uncharacterized protein n=1 Tax=Halomarina halobia TaxID=3033386 RepID=A0ABD6A637_9EURY|nr:hypothetical protein [Halomarina sp. PSR21]